MTQIGQMYEDEKIEYANQKVKEKVYEMAKAMLDEGMEIVKIKKITGLAEEDLIFLQNNAVIV